MFGAALGYSLVSIQTLTSGKRVHGHDQSHCTAQAGADCNRREENTGRNLVKD